MNNSIMSQFIVDDEQVKQNIESLVKKALKYGKVTRNGEIIIENPTISQDVKLRLCLVLRFLANSLEETISEIVRPVDLTKTLGERMESVGSRLSILVKEGFAKKAGYGKYVVQPYRIEKFLNEIDSYDKSLTASGDVESKTRVRASKKRGPHTNSGVGADILHLIEEGFFKIPKLMSEIKKKLEEEVKYHDIRVIDMTVRKTFVSSKKLLKRIPNEDGGGAEWKYVIR